MTRPRAPMILAVVAAAAAAACTDTPTATPAGAPPGAAFARVPDGPHAFPPAVSDIAAAPDGSILVAVNNAVYEVSKQGQSHVIDVPTVPGAALNGLAAVGRRSFFATSGGPDLAVGAGVWRVSAGQARLVADIEAFETGRDPDAFEGPRWKHQQCEEDPVQGFSAGPQSNPYHLAALTGSDVLVADAAGNTLLRARSSGAVDWVAVFTPPVDEQGSYRVLFPLDDDTDCYVQPVPTSVAVAPDGAYYVGELTGAPAVPGWSRVWRIEPGALNVVCPSASCQEVISGLTSVIDLAFGPDGMLYVLEYDEAGWLAVFDPATRAGGTLNRCDVGTIPGSCVPVVSDLDLPGAITFDGRGDLWLLEGNITSPRVRRLGLP